MMKKRWIISGGIVVLVVGFFVGRLSMHQSVLASDLSTMKQDASRDKVQMSMTNLGAHDQLSASATQAVAKPLVNSGFVYVSDSNSIVVSRCKLTSDGGIGSCDTTGSNFNSPYGLSVNLVASVLYVANGGTDSVTMCTISPSGGDLTNCTTTGRGFSAPSAVAIDNQVLNAYITNVKSNSISHCLIQNDGSLTQCQTVMSSLSAPTDINFSPTNNLIYIVNSGNNTVQVCTPNLQAGTLANCQNTGSNFSTPQSITLDETGNFAYITNQLSSTVNLCQVQPNSGLLQNCVATGSGFNAPTDFAFNNTGTLAYISLANSVSVCHINGDGSLSSCQNYNGNFNNSTGIRVFNH